MNKLPKDIYTELNKYIPVQKVNKNIIIPNINSKWKILQPWLKVSYPEFEENEEKWETPTPMEIEKIWKMYELHENKRTDIGTLIKKAIYDGFRYYPLIRAELYVTDRILIPVIWSKDNNLTDKIFDQMIQEIESFELIYLCIFIYNNQYLLNKWIQKNNESPFVDHQAYLNFTLSNLLTEQGIISIWGEYENKRLDPGIYDLIFEVFKEQLATQGNLMLAYSLPDKILFQTIYDTYFDVLKNKIIYEGYDKGWVSYLNENDQEQYEKAIAPLITPQTP